MIRVCMVAFANYPTDSRVRREAEALVDRGCAVDVICLHEKGEDKIRALNGVGLIQLSIGRYRGQNAYFYLYKYFHFFLTVCLWLSYLHLRNPYHIIQVHTMPDFMVFAAMLPKLLGARVLLDVHDLMPELYQSKFQLDEHHWLIRFITWVERRSISFADRAIAVHKPHLDALVKHGNPPEKFIILLNLPDPKIFSRRAWIGPENDRGFKLIYHGMLAKRNGLRVAMRAVSHLKEEIEGLKFQIFGIGDDLPRLIDLAREQDLCDCVHFSEGYIPMVNLVPVILEADLGIVPILYDNFTRYMLPVKLLEYVALGVPVICSRTETIEFYFDDSMVRFFEPGNSDDLAIRILDLYRNLAERQRIAANADRFNAEYKWEQEKQSYYHLIDKLLNGHRKM